MAHWRLAVGVLELVGEPVEPLVEPVARGGAGGLDVPVAVAQRVQPQLVRDLRRVHRVRQVLKHAKRSGLTALIAPTHCPSHIRYA